MLYGYLKFRLLLLSYLQCRMWVDPVLEEYYSERSGTVFSYGHYATTWCYFLA